VRHVGLEAERVGPIDHFEQLDHPPPTVHAAPTDLALGRQLLAVIGRDVARLRKVSAIFFWLPSGSSSHGSTPPPSRCGRCRAGGRPVRAVAGHVTPLANLPDEFRLFLRAAHGRAAAGRRPDGRDNRADVEVARLRFVRQLLDRIVAFDGRIDIDVRQVQEEIEPVELDAVDLGRRR
jgi:hypothetical protein